MTNEEAKQVLKDSKYMSWICWDDETDMPHYSENDEITIELDGYFSMAELEALIQLAPNKT